MAGPAWQMARKLLIVPACGFSGRLVALQLGARQLRCNSVMVRQWQDATPCPVARTGSLAWPDSWLAFSCPWF
jgi:hypothetical protein